VTETSHQRRTAEGRAAFASVSDIHLLRNIHRRFPTGVTIVATLDQQGEPRGLLVNAFASVSLEPPLVLVCVSRRSRTYEHFFRSDSFAATILAVDQVSLASRFAQSGGEKFEHAAWHAGITGVPIVDNACAYLELMIQDRAQAKTHTVLIGRVIDAGVSDRPPLLYMQGGFWDPTSARPCG
jgi:flavin reductase (DIM6/NTAB) family NADH-FMN oxidoreductase RutF